MRTPENKMLLIHTRYNIIICFHSLIFVSLEHDMFCRKFYIFILGLIELRYTEISIFPRRSKSSWTMLGMAPFISLWAQTCKLTSYPPSFWPHCATPWARSSKEFYGNMTDTWPFIRPISNLWSGRLSKRSSVRLPRAKLTTSLPRFLFRKEPDQPPRNMHLPSDLTKNILCWNFLCVWR